MKILVINCGSSSLKYQLIDMADESVVCKGTIERIGLPINGGENNIIYTKGSDPKILFDREIKNHTDAFNTIKELLTTGDTKVVESFDEIDAIGHRVVQGGDKYTKSVLIDEDVIKSVEKFIPLAPLHNPANLQGYQACLAVVGPDVPQVAVFDTAFHSTMPAKAYMYALPYEYYEKYGVRRYGFHGTSHKFISKRCADVIGKDIESLKIITCHIGNGASIAAVENGKVIDTSMGFTPLDGFMMGTRSGGVDPSIITFLAEKEGLSGKDLETILNKKSGVFGICGYSDDRDVTAKQKEGDEKSDLAHEMQAYQIAKVIGSYVAAMNGVDAIVFTGGIGENGTWLRSRICSYLGYLGVKINEEINECTVKGAEAELTAPTDKVRVFILATNEELMIARDTKNIVENLK
ncbi:MAG: acetate kinase [Eubacterium sp.]|nr:acetate kinase [Eubacterium sp.]